jgi:RNA polymerase sigma-70 factor (ECF subfamily)
MKGKALLLTSLEELAGRTASGDKDAFGEIYGMLVDSIFKYLYWNLGSREDAEDLTEEVFLRCLVNIESYNSKRGPFKAWAFRIAHNVMMDHHRRRGRRPQEELKEGVENGSVSTVERLEKDERTAAIRTALEELTSIQRQVIIMKYFVEMSNAEVARALGRSEGAVNAVQHRALRRMGKLIEERGWQP